MEKISFEQNIPYSKELDIYEEVVNIMVGVLVNKVQEQKIKSKHAEILLLQSCDLLKNTPIEDLTKDGFKEKFIKNFIDKYIS